MSRFKKLDGFEGRVEQMGLEELRQWRAYWQQRADHLAPKVSKDAFKRVHEIDKAIARKQLEQS